LRFTLCIPPQQISPSAASFSPIDSAMSAALRNVSAIFFVLPAGSFAQSAGLLAESIGLRHEIQAVVGDQRHVGQRQHEAAGEFDPCPAAIRHHLGERIDPRDPAAGEDLFAGSQVIREVDRRQGRGKGRDDRQDDC